MGTCSSRRLSTAIGIIVLATGGFWLGAFAWFGGYVWVKQAFALFAIVVGLGVASLRSSADPRGWPFHAMLFFGLQLLFTVCVAAGQVFYLGPNGLMDCVELFMSAMQGEL